MSKKNFWNRWFHSKDIRFLGIKDSGKTQIWSSLGDIDAHPGTESGAELVKPFVIEFNDTNEVIYVKKGFDYGGGGLDYFKRVYLDSIIKGDMVFFVIDIDAFIKNKITDDEEALPHRDAILARLDFINRNTPYKYTRKVSVILTHADLVPKASKELINIFMRQIKDKTYEVLSNGCYPINAKDEVAVKNLFKKIANIV